MLKNLFNKRARVARVYRASKHRVIHFERLESRCLLAEFVVGRVDIDLGSDNPPGVHTLRSAINAANASPGVDVVTVPANLAGSIIKLDMTTPIVIEEPVTIQSPYGTTYIQLSTSPVPGTTPAAFDFNMLLNRAQGTSVVVGFDISEFLSSGIIVTNLKGGDSLAITGNSLHNNENYGIEIRDSSYNTIEISANQIYGNSTGIYARSPTGTETFSGTLNIMPWYDNGQSPPIA